MAKARGRGAKARKPTEARDIERIADERAQQVALAFLESKRMEELQSYRLRGRRFETLDLDTLNARWAAFFRPFAEGDLSRVTEMDDMAAEMRLRGHDCPVDLVVDALGILEARARKSGLLQNPPDELKDDIGSFLAELNKPGKN